MFAIPFPVNAKPPGGFPSFASVTMDNTSYKCLVVGNIAYFAGSFISVADASGTYTRNRLASLDLTTALWTAWNPNANALCTDLCHYSGSIYIAGDFTTINGGTAKVAFAKVDATTGTYDSAFTVSGSPQNGRCVATDGSNLFVAANTTIALAKCSLTTGTIDGTWSVSAGIPGYVNGLAVSVTDLFVVGGGFSTVQGSARTGGFNVALSNAALGAWNPLLTSGSLFTITLDVTNGWAYVGGTVTAIGGQTRNAIAQTAISNGAVQTWSMDALTSTAVYDIATDGTTVWIAGAFTSLDGSARNRLGAGDTATGTVNSWNPNADAQIDSLARTPSGALIAAGTFGHVGGLVRSHLAVIDAVTGAPY